MPPLQPSSATPTHSRSLRRGLQEGGGGGRRGGNHPAPERSSSFHGRSSTATMTPSDQRQMRRPKTQPELLAGSGWRKMASPDALKNSHPQRRVPAKVLVNVNVQRSIGALQVMASTEWTVEDLVAASLKQYAKEGRRRPLPGTDPSAFSLHYSQFSLESLDPKEKLIDLGSRNFFLCPKPTTVSISASASPSASGANEATSSTHAALPAAAAAAAAWCSNEADKASKITIPWLRFMELLF